MLIVASFIERDHGFLQPSDAGVPILAHSFRIGRRFLLPIAKALLLALPILQLLDWGGGDVGSVC
ncbi:hypothetical protein D3C85_1931930 [compost metagenome]